MFLFFFSFLDIHQCICKAWTKLQPITQPSLFQIPGIPAINNWDPAPIPAEPSLTQVPVTSPLLPLVPASPSLGTPGWSSTRGEKRRGKEKGKGNQRLWVQGKASIRAGMQIPIGIHVNMPGVQVAQAKKLQVQDVVPEETLSRAGDGAVPPVH